MTEYIEREAAIAFINEVEPCICRNPDGAVFSATKDSDMLEFLRAIPAADVVEVVRCKDCKYRQDDDFCIFGSIGMMNMAKPYSSPVPRPKPC